MAFACAGLSCVSPAATPDPGSTEAGDDVLETWATSRVAVQRHRRDANYGAAVADLTEWVRHWDTVLQNPSAPIRCPAGVSPGDCREILRGSLRQARNDANRLSILEMLQESLDAGDLATLDTLLPELMGVKSDSTPAEVRRVFQAVLRHEPSFQTWIEGHGPFAVEITVVDELRGFADMQGAFEAELAGLGLPLSTAPRTIVRLEFEGDPRGQSSELLGPLKQFSIDAVASFEPIGGDMAFEVGASRKLLGPDLSTAIRRGQGDAGWPLKPLWAAMLNAAHRHLLP